MFLSHTTLCLYDLGHESLCRRCTVTEQSSSRPALREIATQFFLIGCVAFGGFMALISVIEEVCVERRKWLSREDMLDGVSLANVLPGPQAVNTVAYVGYRIAGTRGAIAAFAGILLPTWVLVTMLTFLYFGVAQDVSWLDSFFAGMIPAVAAVIVSVVRRLSRKAVTGNVQRGLFAIAIVAMLVAPAGQKLFVNLGVLALAAILGARLLKTAGEVRQPNRALPVGRLTLLLLFPPLLAGLYLLQPPLPENGLGEIALTFSGLSVMLFGGGYVFIPMIMDVVVTQQEWLTMTEFNDGIAFSQVTPGPIMISAAFIGQRVLMAKGILWGVAGSLVGTLAIFAPPALLMVGAAEILDHIRANQAVQGALKGLRAAVVGMILVAAFVILRSSLPEFDTWLSDWTDVLRSIGIFGLALYGLTRRSLSVLVVLPSAGLLGLLMGFLTGAFG